MAELASGPAGEVTRIVLPVAGRGFKYLFQFRKIMKDLEEKATILNSRKTDVGRRVVAATRNAELILDAVTSWQDRVEDIEVEVKMLRESAALINKKYRGWVTFSRFKRGRRAQKKIEVIQGLLEEETAFKDRVSYPNHVQDMGATGNFFPMEDYVVFPSRESVKKKILQVLEDDNIGLVGIYGIAGVGKSMFITAIANQLKREKVFDDVVMLTLTGNPEIRDIQAGVANQIGLMFHNEDIPLSRAQRLYHRLNQNRKSLIILDNVQARVDLATVGIPYKDSCKNCKVIFTTRHEDVCRDMEVQTRINIEALSEQESWHLFRKKTGHAVDSLAIYIIALQILRYCKGRPSEIVTIARTLHGENRLAVWVKSVPKHMKKKALDKIKRYGIYP